jgi:ribosomal protein S18 acetylase RimI-like enzyme
LAEVVRLVRDLRLPIAPVHWPGGIGLAPFSAARAPEAHRLLQRSYENRFGNVPADFDTWWAAVRHDTEFDATLCFCAIAADDSLAAFALCWNSAFVKDFAVDPAFRRRGIGEAMLLTALAVFRSHGFDEVALKVASGNGPATRLYTRLGFR